MKVIETESDADVVRVTEDRRREPRFDAGDASVYLGWWEGDSFCAELSALQNFSRGGAAIEIEAGLGLPESVWLCVVGPGDVTWTPARILGRHGRIARLQFVEPIPYETFELLL